jgi:membrane-associated phospholipid phosphatase
MPMDTLLSQAGLKKFTALGDPTFLVFAAFGTFFYLWVLPERRQLAQDFAFKVGLSIALTVATKFAFLLVHDPHQVPRLRSPSGHVAMSTTVYGCCVMMLVSPYSRLIRWSSLIITTAFLLSLAASRLALGLHSVPEVALGFLIGIICLLSFARDLHKAAVRFDVGQLAALLLLLAVTRFARIDAEGMIAYGARAAMLLTQAPATLIDRSAVLYGWDIQLRPSRLEALPDPID